mgnify:FL=1
MGEKLFLVFDLQEELGVTADRDMGTASEAKKIRETRTGRVLPDRNKHLDEMEKRVGARPHQLLRGTGCGLLPSGL